MSANLTHDERWVYERLIDESALFSPMSEVEAAIYTVLLTRRYTGPRARVRKIVQYFNPGTTGADIERAIESMVSGNLLNGTGDQISLRPDWDVTLAQAIQPRGGFPEQFLDYVDRIRRSREEELLERVGHAADARATQRMRVRIGKATNRIRIGCFSASVLLNDIEDALQRVCAGAHKIQVQVLMFSPEL